MNTSKKNNLTLLSQLFYPELISTGQTLTELAENLKEHNIKVNVIAGHPTLTQHQQKIPKHITHKGIPITRLWSTTFPKINTLGKLVNHVTFSLSVFIYLLIKHPKNTPLLVLTNPPFLPIICAFFSRFKNITFHYLVFDVYPETAIVAGLLSPKSLITKAWNWANSWVYHETKTILVIGRCMEKRIKDQTPKELHKKIKRLHIWANDPFIMNNKPEVSSFRKKWNLENKFVLLYAGNIARFHDIETIMACAKELNQDPNFHFLFVGEGYKKKWALDFKTNHQLTNCSFYPYVEKKELPDLLSIADLGLVSLLKNQVGLSVPSKTFGLLSAGVPVLGIVPEESEIAQVILEENIGFVSKPGDKNQLKNTIIQAKNNPEQLKHMQKNATLAIKNKYSLHLATKYLKKTILDIE